MFRDFRPLFFKEILSQIRSWNNKISNDTLLVGVGSVFSEILDFGIILGHVAQKNTVYTNYHLNIYVLFYADPDLHPSGPKWQSFGAPKFHKKKRRINVCRI